MHLCYRISFQCLFQTIFKLLRFWWKEVCPRRVISSFVGEKGEQERQYLFLTSFWQSQSRRGIWLSGYKSTKRSSAQPPPTTVLSPFPCHNITSLTSTQWGCLTDSNSQQPVEQDGVHFPTGNVMLCKLIQEVCVCMPECLCYFACVKLYVWACKEIKYPPPKKKQQ